MIRVVGTSELEKKLYWYKAKVVKIVDADTVDLMVSLGLHSYSEERFRLRGIDAWEVRGKEREKGLLAKARVEELTEPPVQLVSQGHTPMLIGVSLKCQSE